MGMYDENEDEGSEEDEYGNVHDVPRPRGLPDEDWQGSTEACGSEAAWEFIARGKGRGGMKGKNEKGGGTKGDEEKGGGKNSEEKGKKGGGKEDEESGLPSDSKRDRDQAESTNVIEEASTRLVLTTRYGRAHHGSYHCDAFTGREVRMGPWCPTTVQVLL